MGKFKAIIRLYDFWLIAKMLDGHFDKFHTGVGRLLAEGVDKSLPTGFVNDCILIEFVGHSSYVAGFENIFHIELPFYAQLFRRIVRFRHIDLLLYRFFLVETLLLKKTKKGARMTLIITLKLEFRVQYFFLLGLTSIVSLQYKANTSDKSFFEEYKAQITLYKNALRIQKILFQAPRFKGYFI